MDATRSTLATSNSARAADYEFPSLIVVGRASTVILGVAGTGEDLFGYTDPGFEFERDGDHRPESSK